MVLGEEFGHDMLACSAGGAEEEEVHGFWEWEDGGLGFVVFRFGSLD